MRQKGEEKRSFSISDGHVIYFPSRTVGVQEVIGICIAVNCDRMQSKSRVTSVRSSQSLTVNEILLPGSEFLFLFPRKT